MPVKTENSLESVFLIQRQEKCLCRSDFDEKYLGNPRERDCFQPKYEENTCSLVGGLIGFDHSRLGSRWKSHPKLI